MILFVDSLKDDSSKSWNDDLLMQVFSADVVYTITTTPLKTTQVVFK